MSFLGGVDLSQAGKLGVMSEDELQRQYRVCRTYRRDDGTVGTEHMMARTWDDMTRGLPGLIRLWDGKERGYRFLPTIKVWVETRLVGRWR